MSSPLANKSSRMKLENPAPSLKRYGGDPMPTDPMHACTTPSHHFAPAPHHPYVTLLCLQASMWQLTFASNPSVLADIDHSLRIDERVLRWAVLRRRHLNPLPNPYKVARAADAVSESLQFSSSSNTSSSSSSSA